MVVYYCAILDCVEFTYFDSTCLPSNGYKWTMSWITKYVWGPISYCLHWSPKLLVLSLLNLFWENLVLEFNTYNLLSVVQPTSVLKNLLGYDSSLHFPSCVHSNPESSWLIPSKSLGASSQSTSLSRFYSYFLPAPLNGQKAKVQVKSKV